ncbi:hypothetical protein HDU91_001138, partial [Kappamyces sp. JEL0680]
DHRRYPDFTFVSKTGDFDGIIDAVIISHFHLDHCGALPYFTEIMGYSGPIYMTYPTASIAPILLEDMRKVMVERKNETNFFTSSDIRNCMRKVTAVDLHEIIHIGPNVQLKAYYAGHVLGAALFHIRVFDALGGSETVVYTGDYNMTPDRHLGSAWIDACEPDLLISESTYATTIRDSKRTREKDFLKKVHEAVRKGGKVLIPVFALGRAQELLILIESYWERMSDLASIPIYFSAGLTERANDYYKLFISWTNEKIKKTFCDRNMFDFKMISTWKPEYADEPGPMVLFASPGMLHAGTSLTVFTKWCHDPLNMIIMPGYCVAGTVGAKVLAGDKEIEIDRFKKVQVNMQIKNLSFSAHADAKGIMSLIDMCKAKNVMLVHGEKLKMAQLKERIQSEMGIPTFDPANGETICIYPKSRIPVKVSRTHVTALYEQALALLKENETVAGFPISGCVVVQEDSSQKIPRLSLKLVSPETAQKDLGIHEAVVKKETPQVLKSAFNPMLVLPRLPIESWKESVLKGAFDVLKRHHPRPEQVVWREDRVVLGSLTLHISDAGEYVVSCSSSLPSNAADILTILNNKLDLTRVL